MIYTNKQIKELDRVSRLKIINSITGIKPVISTHFKNFGTIFK